MTITVTPAVVVFVAAASTILAYAAVGWHRFQMDRAADQLDRVRHRFHVLESDYAALSAWSGRAERKIEAYAQQSADLLHQMLVDETRHRQELQAARSAATAQRIQFIDDTAARATTQVPDLPAHIQALIERDNDPVPDVDTTWGGLELVRPPA